MKELNIIQTKLNVRKSNKNTFGGYSYRSAEDIYEALKPLLAETKCTYVIDNSVELIGDRFYIKAVGTLTNEKGESISATSFAREGEAGKGMCEAQNSGSTISYVNKYVTSALFLLHNGEADPDAIKEAPKAKSAPAPQPAEPKAEPKAEAKAPVTNPVGNTQVAPSLKDVCKMVENAKDANELNQIWKDYRATYGKEADFINAIKTSPANPKNAK